MNCTSVRRNDEAIKNKCQAPKDAFVVRKKSLYIDGQLRRVKQYSPCLYFASHKNMQWFFWSRAFEILFNIVASHTCTVSSIISNAQSYPAYSISSVFMSFIRKLQLHVFIQSTLAKPCAAPCMRYNFFCKQFKILYGKNE